MSYFKLKQRDAQKAAGKNGPNDMVNARTFEGGRKLNKVDEMLGPVLS
jgi:hypothetical protein